MVLNANLKIKKKQPYPSWTCRIYPINYFQFSVHVGIFYLHCDSSHKATILFNIRGTHQFWHQFWHLCESLHLLKNSTEINKRRTQTINMITVSLCHPLYSSLKSIDSHSSLLQIPYLILNHNLFTGVSDAGYEDDCNKFSFLHHSSLRILQGKWQHSKI